MPRDTSMTADVGFGRWPGASPATRVVAMAITVPGIERAQAQALVQGAHVVCPYSNATRGNIDVTLTVV